MSPERRFRANEAQWAIQAAGRLILTSGLILGLLIIIGGKPRWSSPSFEAAMAYPYAPESWGIVLALASLVGLVASLRAWLKVTCGALFVVAIWCFFLDISFITTALKNAVAGTTGIPIYFLVGGLCVLVGLVHWRSANDAVHR